MDKYDVVRELGRGVTLQKKKTTKQLVAVKEISYKHKTQEEKKMIVREVNALRDLQGKPFVLQVLDRVNDRENYRLYLITMYYARGTLEDLAKTDLSEPRVLIIAAELATALKHCHAVGVVHRDVKPDNVVFNECGQAILIDLGLCCRENDDSGAGTPYFMSPENISNLCVTSKTDIWSLGVTLYYAKTRCFPFNATNHLSLALNITEGRYVKSSVDTPLFRLIRRMLQVNLLRRPSAEQLLTSDILRPYAALSLTTPIDSKTTSLL